MEKINMITLLNVIGLNHEYKYNTYFALIYGLLKITFNLFLSLIINKLFII